MGKISEQEFERICIGIAADRDTIIKHNPIGSDEETLLWMLLSCLHSYLSLAENETPYFTTRPDTDLYRQAIMQVLKGRMSVDFNAEPYIAVLSNPNKRS